MDGTHIPIIKSKENPSDYYIRKGYYLIIMQALVDYRGVFMDAYIGWPGKVHDARVLVNSSLYQMQHLQHYWNRRLCGVDISLIILGDPAYPLLPWLMKPYIQNGNTSGQQRLLNDRQSRARMTVENTFGKLKGRWRCLMKRMDVSVNSVPNIAARCVTLHNFCVNCTMITVT